MRTIFSIFIASSLAISSFAQDKEPYHLKFKVNGVQNDTVYLANYYGDKLYYRDTAFANSTGSFDFIDTEYSGGIYAVVLPGPRLFEFLINERSINMETDTLDLNGHMKVHTSKENELFFDYIGFLGKKSKESEPYKNEVRIYKEDKERKEKARKELDRIDKEVKNYQWELIKNNQNKLVSKVIQMSLDIEVPEVLEADTSKAGLDKAYNYYLMHYWNNVDLSDDRIVRTPVFHRKLKTYFTTTVVQTPDSINVAADRLLAPIDPSSELRKYIVHFITYTFENSDIMGMDAVFVHMGLNYYCPDAQGVSPAWWMSDEKVQKLCERANKLAPLRIGQKAPYLSLPDSSEEVWHKLYDMQGPYTILYFWDPNCGHCKKETPVLLELYHSKLKPMGIEVYSVGKAVGDDFEDWKKYIREEGLDWLNVGLTKNIYTDAKKNPSKYVPRFTTLESLNYSETYDIYSTPRVFILDTDKIIRAKNISVEQIGELIDLFEEKRSEQSN